MLPVPRERIDPEIDAGATCPFISTDTCPEIRMFDATVLYREIMKLTEVFEGYPIWLFDVLRSHYFDRAPEYENELENDCACIALMVSGGPDHASREFLVFSNRLNPHYPLEWPRPAPVAGD